MSRAQSSHEAVQVALAMVLAILTACVSLGPSTPPRRFALEADFDGPPVAGSGPALVVAAPTAAAGFDGPRIVYVRRAHELEFFARNEWADAPARMLAPLLVRALERSGAFEAVSEARTAAAAGLRLDSELLRLQQDFTVRPSRVTLTVRVQLSDVASRRVLGARELEATEVARSDDPYGGVVAANRAVRRVLDQVVEYCVTTWEAAEPPPSASTPLAAASAHDGRPGGAAGVATGLLPRQAASAARWSAI